jgi:hypothetical protein
VTALEPAPYNPNRLTDEQFAQLVGEVRRQRRVLKPIVVRGAGEAGRYVIVDGEHNWRAAREAGLVEVPIEEINAEEYVNETETRRQTFLRNKRGSYHSVKLGRMLVEAQFCSPAYPSVEEQATRLAAALSLRNLIGFRGDDDEQGRPTWKLYLAERTPKPGTVPGTLRERHVEGRCGVGWTGIGRSLSALGGPQNGSNRVFALS